MVKVLKVFTYIEDVLVVSQCNNKLYNKLSTPGNNGSPSSPVSMLPVDAVVLFVKANDIRSLDRSSICVYNNPVKILDMQ